MFCDMKAREGFFPPLDNMSCSGRNECNSCNSITASGRWERIRNQSARNRIQLLVIANKSQDGRDVREAEDGRSYTIDQTLPGNTHEILFQCDAVATVFFVSETLYISPF